MNKKKHIHIFLLSVNWGTELFSRFINNKLNSTFVHVDVDSCHVSVALATGKCGISAIFLFLVIFSGRTLFDTNCVQISFLFSFFFSWFDRNSKTYVEIGLLCDLPMVYSMYYVLMDRFLFFVQ